jgi:hypothetical protein
MPEYARSLVVVFLIATAVFLVLKRSFSPLMPPGAYQRRCVLFLALSAFAFLSPGFWLYALPASLMVVLASRRESNIPALFFALLFAVPPAPGLVPGFGLVNYLLAVDHPRLLALLLLLPAAVTLWRKPSRQGMSGPDKLFAGYVLLQAALVFFRAASFTNGLREVVNLFLALVLPYYVMSRSFTNLAQLKDAAASFCLSGAVLGAIAIFELSKNWLLYRSLLDHWASDSATGAYLVREGLVRASVSTGHSIVLGYILAMALVCYFALRGQLRPGVQKNLAFALLLGGILATLSRGPWLGAAAAAFTFWATANASRMRVGVAVGVMTGLAFVFDAQFGLLRALTQVDQSTVDYRAELLAKSMEVFSENPWLGSDQFVERLAAKGMIQGQGIVDVVNTYLGVALSTGVLGLTFFLCLFTTLLLSIWKSRRKYAATEVQGLTHDALRATTPGATKPTGDSSFSPFLTARMLLAVLLGTLVTIATASSVLLIPWVYWAWIGMAVAYARIAAGKTGSLVRA